MYPVPKFGQIFELKMANTLTTADDGVGAYSSTIRKCYNEKWQHLQIEKETRLFRMFNFKTEQFTPQHNPKEQLFSLPLPFLFVWLSSSVRSPATLSLYFPLASVENNRSDRRCVRAHRVQDNIPRTRRGS